LLVDLPVALGLAPVTWLAGPVAAYHTALLGHLALGASGLTWWCTRRGVHPAIAIMAGLLFAWSPFTRGVVASGVPEALAVGLAPWLMDALWHGLRGHRGALVAAIALCCLLALDGIHALLAGALVGAAVLGHTLWRTRTGAVLARALLVVGVTAIPVALTWWGLVHTEHPAVVPRAVADGMLDVDPLRWVTAPIEGADLLNVVAPAQLLPTAPPHHRHRHVVYLGWTLLLAGLLAWREVRTRPVLTWSAVALLLALGPWLRVADIPLIPLPALALDALGIHNLYRLAGLTVLGLIGSAALAAHRIPLPAALGVGLIALLEGVTLAPVPVPVPTVAHPAGDMEVWLSRTEGAIIDLPFDREGLHPRGPWPQRTLMLQTSHGRPIASGLYRRPLALSHNETLQALDAHTLAVWASDREWGRLRAPGHPPADGNPAHPRPTLPAPDRRTADRRQLAALGFTTLVMDFEALPPGSHGALAEALELWLGHPTHRAGARVAWMLSKN
jgi:hypothetical protein